MREGYNREVAVKFLVEECGARKIPHSGRVFLEHLIGVEAIVQRWGGDEDTCAGALFHSVYGTASFKRNPLTVESDRPKVQAIIGEHAERLAWIYCVFERATLGPAIAAGEPFKVRKRDGADTIELSTYEMRALALVVLANIIEQAPCSRDRRVLPAITACTPFLPPRARRDLHAYTAGVATLIGGDVDGFRKAYPDSIYRGAGDVARFAGLADFTIEDLAQTDRKFTKAFFDGRSERIGPGQEREHFDAGHTVYWHSLRSPTIDAWVHGIDGDLGLLRGATRVSCFASLRGAGLPVHYDPNDNIVCQAKGTKRWRASREPVVKYATTGYRLGKDPNRATSLEIGEELPSEMNEPVDVIDMKPGDVTFMPRGIWHSTDTTDDESMHFNIQLGLATWKDALDFVLTTAPERHEVDFRAPVLHNLSTDEPSDDFFGELRERLGALFEMIDENDFDFDMAEFTRFVMKRRSA